MAEKLSADKLPLLPMTDGRTPEQLHADGDDSWSDGARYTPPHLAGAEREAFRRRQDELDQGGTGCPPKGE